MAKECSECLFNRELLVDIIIKNCNVNDPSGPRNISITIHDFKNYILMTMQDPKRRGFRYISKVDLAFFEEMKMQQSLHINFSELKRHLLEMLHKCEKQEMYMKCETEDVKSKLIFYIKSKIRDLIFLAIDFTTTNQNKDDDKNNIVRYSQRQKYEQKIKGLTTWNNQFLTEVFKHVEKFETVIVIVFSNINDKLKFIEDKLMKLQLAIIKAKEQSIIKATTTAYLVQTIRNLRRESLLSLENIQLISELKLENSELQSLNDANENMITDLKKIVSDKDKIIWDLQNEMDILKNKWQDATLIVAEDLIQANQKLIDFNIVYDKKLKEVEVLKTITAVKDSIIKKQDLRYNKLLIDFEEYKKCYNLANENKISCELLFARKRIKELENQK